MLGTEMAIVVRSLVTGVLDGTLGESWLRDPMALRATVYRPYTSGEMVFGAGVYTPGEAVSRRLIAHELTHVMQQGVIPREHGDAGGNFKTPIR